MKLGRILVFTLILFSTPGAEAKGLHPRKIRKLIRKSAVLSRHFTGFALYDPGKKKMVAEQLSDRYFIPASNTKLYTFFTALSTLGDSIPGLQYVERGDSLIFWGTGDPSFLNASLDNGRVRDFLTKTNKTLYFAGGRYTGDFFGSGWQWDDYNGNYQPEITELPMYENMAHFSALTDGTLAAVPSRMRAGLAPFPTTAAARFSIKRDLFDNTFRYPGKPAANRFSQAVPMRIDSNLLVALLQDTLKRPVIRIRKTLPPDVRTLYSIPSDTLYRHLLQPSDNFIAEQLLLLCAAASRQEMNTAAVISAARKTLLADLPDAPQWADGSGLSRMNLFTPRDMVKLLEKIYARCGDEQRLFRLLSIGGKEGTLKNVYKSPVPYVFGKTGTLSNNYNQSGYLLTKSGKRLVFSFMNNNFTETTAEIRSEMERIITLIHEKY